VGYVSAMLMRDEWFVRVKAAVDAVDPVGLLGLGAPDDEYDPEVEELAGWLRGGGQLTPQVIVDVFDRWFWPGYCTWEQAARIAALVVTQS
jgi:hypothetical protein